MKTLSWTAICKLYPTDELNSYDQSHQSTCEQFGYLQKACSSSWWLCLYCATLSHKKVTSSRRWTASNSHTQTNNSGVKLYYRSNNYCSRLKALVAKGQCWVQSSPSDILSVISLVASSHSRRARACAHTASPQKRSSHTDELSWRHTYVQDVIHSVSGIMHAYTAHFTVLWTATTTK